MRGHKENVFGKHFAVACVNISSIIVRWSWLVTWNLHVFRSRLFFLPYRWFSFILVVCTVAFRYCTPKMDLLMHMGPRNSLWVHSCRDKHTCCVSIDSDSCTHKHVFFLFFFYLLLSEVTCMLINFARVCSHVHIYRCTEEGYHFLRSNHC